MKSVLKIVPLCLFLFFFIDSYSQDLITNTLNRKSISLNGTWNYIIDPYETGYYNYRYEPYDQLKQKNNSAFYNNYHTDDKSELVEYDFDRSPTILVPGDWNSQDGRLLYYEGTIWYKRSFDYQQADPNNRLFIWFGAVNYKAEVYLNGTKLGSHTGGFTPFNFEVTGLVKTHDNYLVVKVDNKRVREGIPTLNTDWWNYGGITRDVKLIEEPATFIRDYFIGLKKGSIKTISGYLVGDNVTGREKLTITIPELGLSEDVVVTDDSRVEFEIATEKLELWSPASPRLYTVTITSAYQTIEDQIGFRSISTEGPDILLNGKSIFLKGISIHEENPLRRGRAFGEADGLVLLTWAKELGCNYVRLAHYPHNEHIVRLADRMGMLVWEEIPVYWTVDFTNEMTLHNARNQLAEAITRDKNRASIIIWSVANETPPSDIRNRFLVNLADHARALDGTRLVSAALEKHFRDGVNIVDDEMGNHLDIVAFNQYTGWYGGSLEDAPDSKWDMKFNKPVVISEFGGGALQGLHGSIDDRWTEEYQEYLYEQNLKMIERIPNIRGTSPWILADFRSPKRLLPGIQDGWNRKGLISDNGIKKRAFYTLRSFYDKIEEQYE
jgi:beta-glucuronidase